MMYYIYLFPFRRGGQTVYYCGRTNDPVRREIEHNTTGRHRNTKMGPLRVIGQTPGMTEAEVKSWSHKKKEHWYGTLPVLHQYRLREVHER